MPTPTKPIAIPTQLQIEVFAPSIALKIAIQNGSAEIKSATMPVGTSLNCAKVTIPRPRPNKSAPRRARKEICLFLTFKKLGPYFIASTNPIKRPAARNRDPIANNGGIERIAYSIAKYVDPQTM